MTDARRSTKNSMTAVWYRVDNDETVGPSDAADIIEQIKLAGCSRPCLVWTEGMADWTDARLVPTFRTLFRPTSLRTSQPSDEIKSLKPAARAPLLQRLRHELIEYLIISGYLYICFGSLIFYKAAILRGHGIEFSSLFGLALVKALVLGKFILILQALGVGRPGGRAGALLASVLKTSVLFVVCLIVLSVIEEMTVGYFHGEAARDVLSEMTDGTLTEAFAVGALMLLILIPYFALRGAAVRLGDGTLWKIFTEHEFPASQPKP
jgi:GYF domain 2